MKGKHRDPRLKHTGMTGRHIGIATSAFGLLAMTVIVAMASVAYAGTCAYRDGGYCVSSIAEQVAEKIGVPTETMLWGKSKWGEGLWAKEGVLGGTEYLNYYETIWDKMLNDGKATQQDRERAFEGAKKAGGTKIGGVNLVVLSAMTLQQLINQKIIAREDAQKILNEAKVLEK